MVRVFVPLQPDRRDKPFFLLLNWKLYLLQFVCNKPNKAAFLNLRKFRDIWGSFVYLNATFSSKSAKERKRSRLGVLIQLLFFLVWILVGVLRKRSSRRSSPRTLVVFVNGSLSALCKSPLWKQQKSEAVHRLRKSCWLLLHVNLKLEASFSLWSHWNLDKSRLVASSVEIKSFSLNFP